MSSRGRRPRVRGVGSAERYWRGDRPSRLRVVCRPSARGCADIATLPALARPFFDRCRRSGRRLAAQPRIGACDGRSAAISASRDQPRCSLREPPFLPRYSAMAVEDTQMRMNYCGDLGTPPSPFSRWARARGRWGLGWGRGEPNPARGREGGAGLERASCRRRRIRLWASRVPDAHVCFILLDFFQPRNEFYNKGPSEKNPRRRHDSHRRSSVS